MIRYCATWLPCWLGLERDTGFIPVWATAARFVEGMMEVQVNVPGSGKGYSVTQVRPEYMCEVWECPGPGDRVMFFHPIRGFLRGAARRRLSGPGGRRDLLRRVEGLFDEWGGEMRQEEFHASDVLTVGTGTFLSVGGFDSLMRLLQFMTGHDLYTHQVARAMSVCKNSVLQQFPWITSPAFASELNKLVESIETTDDPEVRVRTWLTDLTSGRLGSNIGCSETLLVDALSEGQYVYMDPIDELNKTRAGK
jgi:hypothetical protein